MNCPLCNIALKVAGHRGVDVNYCQLCGGTWLDRRGFENLAQSAGAAQHARRPMLRVALIAGLVLAACLLAAVSIGAVKVCPAVRSWTEGLLGG